MRVRRTILFYIIILLLLLLLHTKLARVVIYFFNSDYARGGNIEQRIMLHIDIPKYIILYILYCVDIGPVPLKYYFRMIRHTTMRYIHLLFSGTYWFTGISIVFFFFHKTSRIQLNVVRCIGT